MEYKKEGKIGDYLYMADKDGGTFNAGIVIDIKDGKIITKDADGKKHQYSVNNKKIIGFVDGPAVDQEPIPDDVIKPNDSDIYYSVKEGDSLNKIADRYNTDVATLQGLNKISNPESIQPGEKILLPDTAADQEPAEVFTGIVTTKKYSLNVRSGAGPQYPVVKKLPKGSYVKLSTAGEGWYRLADKSGFVSANLITRAV